MKAKSLELQGNIQPRDERYCKDLDDLLKPEAIVNRSQLTLEECMPELERIAHQHGLNMAKDWTAIKRIYDLERL